MQFKSLLALFTMIVAVVAAPAMDDHKTHDLHKVNDFDDGKENASDDHSVKNEVDIEADDHSSNDKDDHSNSCGENQTSMCCDSFNKKDVNGLELLLGQGCIANGMYFRSTLLLKLGHSLTLSNSPGLQQPSCLLQAGRSKFPHHISFSLLNQSRIDYALGKKHSRIISSRCNRAASALSKSASFFKLLPLLQLALPSVEFLLPVGRSLLLSILYKS